MSTVQAVFDRVPNASRAASDFPQEMPLDADVPVSSQSAIGTDRDGLEPIPEVSIERWTVIKSGDESLKTFESRSQRASAWINASFRRLRRLPRRGLKPSAEGQLLLDYASTLRTALQESQEAMESVRDVPSVALPNGSEFRPCAIADSYLRSVGYVFDLGSFRSFVKAVQNQTELGMAEIWSLKAFLQFSLLERIASLAARCTARGNWAENGKGSAQNGIARRLSVLLKSLQRVADLDWKPVFEGVNKSDEILKLDPAGAYSQMDFDSRQMYRTAISELAKSSARSEPVIALTAVKLARQAAALAGAGDIVAERKAHVGYYLLDGRSELEAAIDYCPSLARRCRKFLLASPEWLYFGALGLATASGMALLHEFLGFRLFSFVAGLVLLLLLDRGVAIINLLITTFLPPRRIPKLDFSKGIPADRRSMVVVPSLLISEAQTKKMVRDLEIRYLANKDANLHFALITDAPDSPKPVDEKDSLAQLCAQLIGDLNHKYGAGGKGPFFLFHRSRTYNPGERMWMGWERKRGKLLQFNNLLLGRGDDFSVKAGDLSILRKIKYVITLDLDTQLPRGTAHRLVGAMAHPLNRAVIDPITNMVIAGYGVLQPRIDISMESANRSRLAAIFSGDTGFDLYTRAVSDVYQDLFGQGTFAGKGIYEVSIFQQVLERRFPANTVLSHDLIEGAHARAGLISDVEMIDDYPSNFSAFSRRKHRWIRGDWQILAWLFPGVRNGLGKIVWNPLNLLSRWKIVDNLRRSLTECTLLSLFVFAWLASPAHPLLWTLVLLGLMALPAFLRTLISIVRGGSARYTAHFWKHAGSEFAAANVALLFRVTFIFYESLVSLDAVIRTLVRLTLTRTNLLQWETAAETELGLGKKSAVDAYVNLTPVLALGLWLIIGAYRPASMLAAIPLVTLWVVANPMSAWLSRASGRRRDIAAADRDLLRDSALRTWRFFRAHSDERENWLIPDVVQALPYKIGHRVSSTDLGLLLNARLAACDLGFLTMPEFVYQTEKTLDSVDKMPKYQGHLYNWYDTQTLEPMRPLFVSTVDNGNLLCSLWTLKQGCLQMLKTPLFRRNLLQGIQDHMALVAEMVAGQKDAAEMTAALEPVQQQLSALLSQSDAAKLAAPLAAMLADIETLPRRSSECVLSDEVKWWVDELSARLASAHQMVKDFAPWTLPEFSQIREAAGLDGLLRLSDVTLESAPRRLKEMEAILASFLISGRLASELRPDIWSLQAALVRSLQIYKRTAGRLASLASRADVLAEKMDFSLLYNTTKKLLSIGIDGEAQKVSAYHYDLLASEARAAAFGAIAKGDIPQESWLRLDRPHALHRGERVLMSWSGTMFEYLMPLVWMRSYRRTMLHKAARAAIRVQQKFTQDMSIPWGVSECACGEISDVGEYIYHAFGVPGLALNRDDHSGDIVIAPYSSFLACLVDSASGLHNIRRMRSLGWLGSFGFYDAVDYTPSRAKPHPFKVVSTWMAHHQGMSLISAANVLCGSSMQRYFHAEPLVAASERLLHEKVSSIRILKAGWASGKNERRSRHPRPSARWRSQLRTILAIDRPIF